MMAAEVSKNHDEHRWVLGGRRVTQVTVDLSSVRLYAWTLDGDLEVRAGVPFSLRRGNTETRFETEQPATLGPVLALLGSTLHSLTVSRFGSLLLRFDDGSELQIEPHDRFEAWEAHGSGSLEGVAYLAGPPGQSPWG